MSYCLCLCITVFLFVSNYLSVSLSNSFPHLSLSLSLVKCVYYLRSDNPVFLVINKLAKAMHNVYVFHIIYFEVEML